MTTTEQIREAYKNTLQCAFGNSLDSCLEYFGEVKSKVVYGILTYLQHEKSNFNAKIFSSGRIETFYVIYKLGEFEILVERFEWEGEYPFSTVESFAKWLNDCEEKILEAARTLVK